MKLTSIFNHIKQKFIGGGSWNSFVSWMTAGKSPLGRRELLDEFKNITFAGINVG